MIALLLLGCPKPEPPTLYPLEVPTLDQAPALDYERAPATCAEVEAVQPGEPFPQAAADGTAGCGGLLVPDDQFAELLHDADVSLPWYRTYAEECADGRTLDREWAQAPHDQTWRALREAEDANRGLRLAAPALFVLGVALGTGVGVTASQVQFGAPR